MDGVSKVGTWSGPNPPLGYWSWTLINHEGKGTNEGPQPSGTTGLGTWAEEQQFPSFEARGVVFPGRGGVLGPLECWEGVVRRQGTHPSCLPCGAGPGRSPPLVLERVVAYLGTQGQ